MIPTVRPNRTLIASRVALSLRPLAAGLAGCTGDGNGGDGGSGSDGSDGGSGTTTGSTTDQQVEIEFWDYFGGTEDSEMKKLKNEFEERNPNITVNTQAVPFGDVPTKVVSAAASGNTPHVFTYWMSFSSYYEAKGILDPIDDYLSDGLNPYYDLVEPAATAGGNVVALPMDIHAMMLATNDTVLEEAGAPMQPTTHDEFVSAANAIQENTDKRPFFLQTANNSFAGFRVYYSLLRQQGGKMFEGEDGDLGQPVFHESDAGIAAAEFYDLVTGQRNWDNADDISDSNIRVNEFKNDQAGMGFIGNWTANNFQNEQNEFIDGLEFTYHQPWGFGGDTKSTFCESNGFFFPSNPDHTEAEKEARVKFVEYVTQNNPIWATKATHLPSTPEVATSDTVTSHPIYQKYEIVKTLQEMASNGQLTYQPRATIDLYAPEIGKSLSSIYAQNMEPQEALTQSANAISDRMS
ncbi:extracellular solute-binding protein [Haloarcula halophila]|uniref:extracellular solute-binding protein n=1 Tax=Haloarcula halophila TaxID=3032584 RepID=UPI003AF32D45